MFIENKKGCDFMNRNIVFDMDGVLADFFAEPNNLERFENERGFFKNLKPIANNNKMVRDMIYMGFNVYIISASPNKQADKEKRQWLSKYIPNLKKENIIICRNGQNKADFMQDIENSILIDDYTQNLIQWKAKGGKTLKYINAINDKNGVHKVLKIKELKDFKDIFKMIDSI